MGQPPTDEEEGPSGRQGPLWLASGVLALASAFVLHRRQRRRPRSTNPAVQGTTTPCKIESSGATLRDSAGDWASDRSGKGSSSGGTDVTDSCRSVRRARSNDLESARSIPGILQSRSIGNTSLLVGPELGRGSFGKVFKGRWKGAQVAIKVIEHRSSEDSKIDGLREAILSTNIQHPNVLITFQVITKAASDVPAAQQQECPDTARACEGQGPPSVIWHPTEADPSIDNVKETWLISEYCDKGNLDSAIAAGKFHDAETGKPDMVAVYRCLIDMAAGMDYLHSLGILHGDFKGGNVLLKSTCLTEDPRGFVCKIGDFGLSRVLAADTTHVTTENVGTVAYCAPEVLKHGRLTRAADVFAFAMVMWELWTGEGIMRGLNSAQAFFKVAMGFRPTVAAAMPREYRELMTACWSEDPAQRPGFEEIESTLCEHYCAFASCRKAGVPCQPRSCGGAKKGGCGGPQKSSSCGGAQESRAAANSCGAASGAGCRKGACG